MSIFENWSQIKETAEAEYTAYVCFEDGSKTRTMNFQVAVRKQGYMYEAVFYAIGQGVRFRRTATHDLRRWVQAYKTFIEWVAEAEEEDERHVVLDVGFEREN